MIIRGNDGSFYFYLGHMIPSMRPRMIIRGNAAGLILTGWIAPLQ